ncbi:MAG: rane protein [Verrucomicrobiaceae bacterium]|nr:rane protein [Verrucomicrobiaceae bacterium]
MPQYREATLEDLSAICTLGDAVNMIHHEAIPHIFAATGEPNRDMEYWRGYVGGDTATTFVACLEGLPIAFATVSVNKDVNPMLQPLRYARIGTVSVAERFRGQGIGRKLMALSEDWSRRRDAFEMRIHVWSFNARALTLYEELGYAERSLNLGKLLS